MQRRPRCYYYAQSRDRHRDFPRRPQRDAQVGTFWRTRPRKKTCTKPSPKIRSLIVLACGVALTPIGQAFGFLSVPARLLLAIGVIVLA
jgi:hypothetical protein